MDSALNAAPLVHGASGGVGTTLVQLAPHGGIRVIGTAATRHHDALRTLGAEPDDYHAPDLAGTVRRLAPSGINAVFDHLGGPSFRRSFDLLAPAAPSSPTAPPPSLTTPATRSLPSSPSSAVPASGTCHPTAGVPCSTTSGAASTSDRRFRRHLAADLTEMVNLLADGALTSQIAARYPLADAGDAMKLAESRTVRGKVIFEPQSAPASDQCRR